MYDTPYWDRRWGRTAGYTFFQEEFSAGDLINARIRYRRYMDEPLEWRIKQLVDDNISLRHLWAGIASPKEAFWDGDWKDYASAGQSLYESALMNLLVVRRPPNQYLSLDELKRAKVLASKTLADLGYRKDQEKKPEKVPVPAEIKKEVDYEMMEVPNPIEIFGNDYEEKSND